ncbi:MAG TPA: GspE/PulE family protein [Oligoflexia bacterium]|nr:GspE/PulE family protein [Oligoflexia bacterium]HMP26861.1 GspE/PulE family protein [Oligoflexia bacterium]
MSVKSNSLQVVPSYGNLLEESLRVLTPKEIASISTASARECLHFANAERYGILPIKIEHRPPSEYLLCAAGCRAKDPELNQALNFITGRDVLLVQVNDKLLAEAIPIAYHGDGARLEKEISLLKKEENKIKYTKENFNLGDGGKIGKFINELFNFALANNFSDLHLTPKRNSCVLSARKNGEMMNYYQDLCSSEVLKQIIRRIKVLAALDITCDKLPQDGAIKINSSQKDLSARVSLMPTIWGEKLVVRLHSGIEISSFEDLGFPEMIKNQIDKAFSKTQGLIIVSGPTCSGKSTTLYSMLSKLSRKALSILTIEDPVEITLEGIGQININEKNGLTFGRAIKSSLRQNPNILMIGEIRDNESAKAVFEAASTGHLVLSSLHCGSVREVFFRFKTLGITLDDCLNVLSLIINQRLVSKLCATCKVIDLPSTKKMGFEVFRGVGCQKCDYSGYSGKTVVLESLKIGEKEREILSKEQNLNGWQKLTSQESSYFSPLIMLKNLLRNGVISAENLTNYVAP